MSIPSARLLPSLSVPVLALRWRIGLITILGAAACRGPTESTAVVLGNPVQLSHPFSGISCITELSDGRVLVLDAPARVVQLADFSTQDVSPVGGHGKGPGQYSMPDWLIPIPGGGDTTLIDDARDSRYAIAVGGRLLVQSIPRDPGAPMIRAVDSAGYAYMQPDLDAQDSVPLIRVSRRRTKSDTAAYLSTGLSAARVPHRFVLEKLPPYPKNDTWGVLPDGTVLIARIWDYHVESLSPTGKRREGERVDFQRIRNQWGDSEPPFVSAPVSLDRVSPSGLFWVERTTPEHERQERYDVFNAKGEMIREVMLPTGARLVGLGRRYVYAVTTDAGGVELLERLEPLPDKIKASPAVP